MLCKHTKQATTHVNCMEVVLPDVPVVRISLDVAHCLPKEAVVDTISKRAALTSTAAPVLDLTVLVSVQVCSRGGVDGVQCCGVRDRRQAGRP